MNHRVVIYVRISKDRADQGSIETQEYEATQFATSKGWTIVDVCRDKGRSAYKRNVKRPAFDQAMKMIETKQATTLMVWKLDRFYRGLTEFNSAWDRIRNNGGQLVSVTEPMYDTTSDDPMIRVAIMGFAAMAETESRTKSHRSKSDHMKAFRDGRIPPGPIPFGYKKPARGELVEHPEQAEFIRDAAKRILNRESLRSIVKGTTFTGATGKPMTPRGLRFILTCPRTAGLRKHTDTGSLIQGSWKAILDRETWDQLNQLFDDPSRDCSPIDGKSHVLSGIMVCGKCNGRIGSRTWKDQYRYQCRECGQSMDETKANAVVKSKVLDMCPQSEWEVLRTQGRGFDPKVIEDIKNNIAAVDGQFERGAIDADRWMNLNAKFNDQLTAAMSTVVPDVPAIGNLADEWDSMSMDDVRRVITFITKEIKLMTVKGSTVDPYERVQVS